MRKATQCERILRYLEDHEDISQLEAMTRLGIGRLAARIHDMEGAGHKFTHRMVSKKDELGNTYRYMRYGRT